MAERKHSWVRRMLGLGVLAGATYAVWRAVEANRTDRDLGWEPQPFPFPPQPRNTDAVNRAQRGELARERAPAAEVPSAAASDRDNWVPPLADGACPASHPVKAKLSSGIFHEPNGLNYDRTHPDRCYRDADTAVADGLRPSKR